MYGKKYIQGPAPWEYQISAKIDQLLNRKAQVEWMIVWLIMCYQAGADSYCQNS